MGRTPCAPWRRARSARRAKSPGRPRPSTRRHRAVPPPRVPWPDATSGHRSRARQPNDARVRSANAPDPRRHGVRSPSGQGVTLIVPCMSGPWRKQMYLKVPGFVNVTEAALGSGVPWQACRQRRLEEPVAVVRPVIGVAALRVGAIREDRRHLVLRGSDLQGGSRSSSGTPASTWQGRRRRCAPPMETC